MRNKILISILRFSKPLKIYIPYKYRRLNKLLASVNGYFWSPCPICGQNFGGHECRSGANLYRKDSTNSLTGWVICPKSECIREAEKRNEELYLKGYLRKWVRQIDNTSKENQ